MNNTKFLANENFPYKSIFYLIIKNFDVLSIGMNHQDLKDFEVMNLAFEPNRTILAFDRDYGKLIFKNGYKPAAGIIYLRLDQYEPEEPARLIESILKIESIQFENCLTVLDYDSIRQKKH